MSRVQNLNGGAGPPNQSLYSAIHSVRARTIIAVGVIAILLTSISGLVKQTVAGERVDICAQYTATGKSYHVFGISMTGSELNQATRSLDYNALAHFIVIFWAPDQASVIEIDGIFSGPSPFGSAGIDQEGRSWKISSYSPLVVCGSR
jgi:hypothetical protein